jgi:arylsulfatase A-like enzyme
LAPGAGDGDLVAELRAAGVRTARVGPPRPADGWEIDVPAERPADDPLSLKPTRRAVRQAIEQLGDAANALLWVEVDALLPPWRPSEDALAEAFADTADEESDEPLEPWVDDLPERIDVSDEQTFARLQRTYAAAVATFDVSLDKLLTDCTKRGWGDDAVWVLTAGRGFPLGEHGAVGFTVAGLHEELVHLPLMLCWPHAEHAGLRVSAFTQPADFGATLRELFGLPLVEAGDPWAGRSLVGLARGGDVPVRDRAVSGLRVVGRTLWGVRSAGWYLLLDDHPDGERRLFVKPDDRWEVNDVRPRNQDLAEEMEREFRKLLPG